MAGADMNPIELLQAARAAGISIGVDGADLVLEAAAAPPPALLELLSHHKARIIALLRAHTPTPDALARTQVHPRLRHALAREIYSADPAKRAFWLDTRTRARVPLAEQCPKGIDVKDWRRAVSAAGESMEAARRWTGSYPDDPVIIVRPETPQAAE